MTVTCVLVAEGSSDLCIQRFAQLLQPTIAFDFKPGMGIHFSHPPRLDLVAKVQRAIKLFSPQLLLVHRDADKAGVRERIKEIRKACADCVPVIPVREIEAWLLADRNAILEMTDLSAFPQSASYPPECESVNAKKRLEDLLMKCRLTSGWRPEDFNFYRDRAELGRKVTDLNSLRQLKSFVQFEEALQNAITALRS